MHKGMAAGLAMLALGCGPDSAFREGTSAGRSRSAVINGSLDGDLHPNVGALARPFPNAGDPFGARCSGVLLTKRVYLTAAHCLVNLRALGFGAHGSFGVSFEPEITSTSKFYFGTMHPHPAFLVDDLVADVGVIVLDEEVHGIKPAKLPRNNFLEKLTTEEQEALVLTGVGYGAPTPDLEPRGIRRYSTHPFIELFGRELGYDFDDYLVLGGPFADGHGTSSNGDSGGPHFLGDRVISVTSFANFGTEEAGLEYSQRVDLPFIRNFIQSFFEEDPSLDE